MNTHPCDLNTNAYNFFFHPLNKAKENPLKATAAIIVHIALTALTFFVWQIPFWIVNRLDNRKIVLWEKEEKARTISEKVSHIQSQNPLGTQLSEQPNRNENVNIQPNQNNAPANLQALPLEKTGRILHGQNTCFLATAIQLCRQLPDVQRVLGKNLNNIFHEPQEKYELRKAVHHHLKTVIGKSKDGIDISSEEMEELHSILHRFAPEMISKPGQSGCLLSAINILLTSIVLSGPNSTFSKAPSICPENRLPNYFMEAMEGTGCASQIKLEHNIQVKEDSSRNVKYLLAGVGCFGTGHAIAYIKDLANPSDKFIVCDDMAPHKIANEIESHSIFPANRFAAIYLKVAK